MPKGNVTEKAAQNEQGGWVGFLNLNWREFSKAATLVLVALACLGAAIFLIYLSYISPNPSTKEGLYKDVITFILSFIGSVIAGYWFARLGNLEKVDTIAERSTEKMVLLSIQLENLRTFLEETETIAKREIREGVSAGAISAYRHRIQSASHLISILASSNETFRSDWLGVVSTRMKQQIESKYEKLRAYFDASLKLREGFSHSDESRATVDSSKLESVSMIEEAQRTIDAVRKDLPIPPAQSGAHSIKAPRQLVPRAVTISQLPGTAPTDASQSGEISVNVIRPIFSGTGTGRLQPAMASKPHVKLTLISGPSGVDVEWNYYVGVGTPFDFNVKLQSCVFGTHLPIGEYKFHYHALAQQGVAAEVS